MRGRDPRFYLAGLPDNGPNAARGRGRGRWLALALALVGYIDEMRCRSVDAVDSACRDISGFGSAPGFRGSTALGMACSRRWFSFCCVILVHGVSISF